MATILLKRCTRRLATDKLLNMAKIARKNGFSRLIDEYGFKYNQDAALIMAAGVVAAIPVAARNSISAAAGLTQRKAFAPAAFWPMSDAPFSSNGAAGGDRPWRRRGNTCRTIHSVTFSA
ncbi:hypothetical protein [Rhizobium etli]|uniref:hypothetical protein n=1 Tax=Rhizobium etli TaxID=29449 RepID=UPI00163F9E01|nr:hypothetical protein [Rhizobium sp. IE4771]